MSDEDACVVCGELRPQDALSSLGRCWDCIQRATREHDARFAAEREASAGSWVTKAPKVGETCPDCGERWDPFHGLDCPGRRPARERPSEPVLVALSEADTPYGLAALRAECARVASTPHGVRDDTLNTAAMRIAGLVKGGELTKQTAYDALYAAGLACGQPEWEVRRALR